MADTLPNIDVIAGAVVDLYAVSGITVGVQISVKMIGHGEAMLYAGATLSAKPTNQTGFTPIYPKEELVNAAGDSGAWLYSESGCTVNVGVF